MRGQKLKTLMWERYKWTDPNLMWNASEHGGITQISASSTHVWVPDVVLGNVADQSKTPGGDENDHVWISSNGTVFMARAVIRSTRCIMNLEFFPFDQQECSFHYFSWQYSSSLMELRFLYGDDVIVPSDVDVSRYTETEWSIVNTSGFTSKKLYPCCDDPFDEMMITVRLSRIYHFYNLLLVWPGIILSLLAAIVFWLPPGSSDKTGIGLSVFLSFFLLLIILKEVMPMGQKNIPRLASLSYKNMFAIFASVLISTFVLNIYAKANGDKRVPHCLKVVFIDLIARIILMQSGVKSREKVTLIRDVSCEASDVTTDNDLQAEPPEAWQRKLVMCISALVQIEAGKLRTKREESEIANEWFILAKVIDRLFFIGYTCFLMATLSDWIHAVYSHTL